MPCTKLPPPDAATLVFPQTVHTIRLAACCSFCPEAAPPVAHREAAPEPLLDCCGRPNTILHPSRAQATPCYISFMHAIWAATWEPFHGSDQPTHAHKMDAWQQHHCKLMPTRLTPPSHPCAACLRVKALLPRVAVQTNMLCSGVNTPFRFLLTGCTTDGGGSRQQSNYACMANPRL